jgi:hypothetical protein
MQCDSIAGCMHDHIPGVDSLYLSVDDRSAFNHFNVLSLVFTNIHYYQSTIVYRATVYRPIPA